jgi:hypothetical protein
MKKAVLMVSTMGNQIYLGTRSKKDPNSMNASRVNFTNQAIVAVIQHIKGQGNHIETEFGKLIWEPREG